MDVISILTAAMERPDEFRALLVRRANSHANAEETTSGRAAQGARAAKNAALRAYDWVGSDDLSVGERARCIAAETGTLVQALNEACVLVGVNRAQRTAALVAWEGKQ